MPDGEKGLSLWEMYPAERVLCVIGILASYLQHPLQARAGGLFVEGVGADIRRGGGVMELPQPLGEGIRADELSTLAGELDYSVFFDRMSISGGRHEADTRICRYTL